MRDELLRADGHRDRQTDGRTDRQTDRHDKAISRVSQLLDAPKSNQLMLYRDIIEVCFEVHTYLFTYLLYLLTYLLTYLFTYLLTYLLAYILMFITQKMYNNDPIKILSFLC